MKRTLHLWRGCRVCVVKAPPLIRHDGKVWIIGRDGTVVIPTNARGLELVVVGRVGFVVGRVARQFTSASACL